MKLKRLVAAICAVLALLACAGCGGAPETPVATEQIPLTEEEQEILTLMGDDVHQVAEEDWAETVTELQAHCSAFTGQVYQLEGIYRAAGTLNGEETPWLYRTLVNGSEKTECGMPLKYLEKDLPDGTWVRVSAIVNGGEYGGETVTVLEVFAAETLSEAGSAELSWSGSSHNHS